MIPEREANACLVFVKDDVVVEAWEVSSFSSPVQFDVGWVEWVDKRLVYSIGICRYPRVCMCRGQELKEGGRMREREGEGGREGGRGREEEGGREREEREGGREQRERKGGKGKEGTYPRFHRKRSQYPGLILIRHTHRCCYYHLRRKPSW